MITINQTKKSEIMRANLATLGPRIQAAVARFNAPHPIVDFGAAVAQVRRDEANEKAMKRARVNWQAVEYVK